MDSKDLQIEEQKRQNFCEILLELAKTPYKDSSSFADIYKKLEDIYYTEEESEKFRHFYSDIFSVLTQIKGDPLNGSLDLLGFNIQTLRNEYKAERKSATGKLIDIKIPINKLYDHVNLDIARISFSEAMNTKNSAESSEKRLLSIEKQLNSLKGQYKDIGNNSEKLESKLDNAQKEYIAILGIFASIVLTFTGGLAYSASVLNNIANSSIYRTIFISLIIGLILVNILFGLYFYINKLVNKAISTKPLIFSSIIIIALMVLTGVAWNFGLVEKRNSRLYAPQSNSVTQNCN